MARTIAIWGPTALATPTCKLMLEGALTTLVETITLSEHATVKRLYTGTVTAGAGHYRYNLLTAGAFIGGGAIYVGATDATTYEEDNLGNLSSTTVGLIDGAITDAKFTVPALTGVATGPVGWLHQLWRRFFKKATQTDLEIKTYADNGTSVLTTQPVSDDGTTENQGAAV